MLLHHVGNQAGEGAERPGALGSRSGGSAEEEAGEACQAVPEEGEAGLLRGGAGEEGRRGRRGGCEGGDFGEEEGGIAHG